MKCEIRHRRRAGALCEIKNYLAAAAPIIRRQYVKTFESLRLVSVVCAVRIVMTEIRR